MGPLPTQDPFRVFTLSSWHFTCCLSTSLSKDLKNSQRHQVYPVSQSCKSQSAKGSPLLLLKLLTQVDKLHLSMWLIYRGLSHIGGPLRMSLLGHRLLMLYFLVHNRPHCQVETHSLIMFNSIITFRDAEFFRSTGFLSIYIAVFLPSVSAHCTLVWHCVGHDPYFPSGQSGKSTLTPPSRPPCHQQSMPPYSANRNSLPVMPFNAIS